MQFQCSNWIQLGFNYAILHVCAQANVHIGLVHKLLIAELRCTVVTRFSVIQCGRPVYHPDNGPSPIQ